MYECALLKRNSRINLKNKIKHLVKIIHDKIHFTLLNSLLRCPGSAMRLLFMAQFKKCFP